VEYILVAYGQQKERLSNVFSVIMLLKLEIKSVYKYGNPEDCAPILVLVLNVSETRKREAVHV
jgi:hypothetical protein